MAITLIRTDRNGTKYYMDNVCPKCDGVGTISYYGHVAGGVCFKCNGTGTYRHSWKEYTPEYAKTLEQRRIDREKRKAPERNRKFFKEQGLSETGEAFIVTGETYSIKEQLKEAGAKFNYLMGWHFDHEIDIFNTVKITVEEIAHRNMVDEFIFNDDVKDIIDKKIRDSMPKSTSEYVGNIGDKISVEVKLVGKYYYEGFYGVTNIYKFVDNNDNIYVWKTSTYKEIELNEVYTLRGTIKEHSEYKDEKQTILIRCKID